MVRMTRVRVFLVGLLVGLFAAFGGAYWYAGGRILAVSDSSSVPAFERSSYLESWADLDGDCQDTRMEVLIAYGNDVRLSDDRCSVVEGEWLDELTGAILDDPSDVAVIHAVSLEEAHVSGGHAWDDARKQAFANDFHLPDGSLSFIPSAPLINNLIITAIANDDALRRKDPAAWMPENPGQRCRYVQRWAIVKAEWGLAMDEAEAAAVSEALSDCPWDWEDSDVRPGPTLAPELLDIDPI